MSILLLVGALALTLLAALLAAAEGALYSLTREDRDALKRDDRRRARALRSLLESPREFLFTLEVAAELGLVGLSLCAAAVIVAEYGHSEAWWTLLLAPPWLLVLCLLLPRAVAARYPRQVALLLAIPLQALYYLLLPLMSPMKVLSEVLLELLHIPSAGGFRLDESEFKTLVDISEKEGTLREQERKLIHNVFEFGDMTVSEVMSPRTEIVGFSIMTPVDRILKGIKEQRFARVPIFKSNLDNILGILYTKDLLALRARGGGGKRTLKELLHPVYYVPVTKKVDELFREFQTQKIHMAVVVDEYGGVAGIVTMDDLLSELFGVMLDEHDVEEPVFTQLAENEYRVQAHMDLEQFCELMQIDMPAEEEVTTAGGLVMGLFGTLPKEGDVVRHQNIEITVEKLEGTRIQELRVRRLPPEPAPTPEEEA